MPLSKEVWLGSILVVAVPILLLFFLWVGVIHNLTSVIENILEFVLGSMIVAGAILIYHGNESKKGQPEGTGGNKTSWLAWVKNTFAITFIAWLFMMLAIIGSVIIYLGVILLINSPPFAIWEVGVEFLAIGLLVTPVSIWGAFTDIRRNRKLKAISNLLDDFKNTLEQAKDAKSPETKATMLEELRNKLQALCEESGKWTRDVRKPINDFLDYAAKEIDEEEYPAIFLVCLQSIVICNDSKTNSVIRDKFYYRIQRLYDVSSKGADPTVLSLLLDLSKAREDELERLLFDAVHKWDNARYEALKGNLVVEVFSLKGRNRRAYDSIKKYFFELWEATVQRKESPAKERAEEIYKRISAS